MVKKIKTVCGYSCSDCDHYGNECPGGEKTKGLPFWTVFVGIDCCPVFECCENERKFPHCGKCPDRMYERFTRFLRIHTGVMTKQRPRCSTGNRNSEAGNNRVLAILPWPRFCIPPGRGS